MTGISHADPGSELTQAEYTGSNEHNLAQGTSFPGSPSERDLFYRSDEHKWYIRTNTEWVELTINSFLDFSDTPSVYSGYAGYFVMVNSTPNALEFVAKSSVSHGSLGNLGNDDHTQYLLANASRAVSGNLVPDGSNTRNLGSTTAEWKNAYIAGRVYFFTDQGEYIYSNGTNLYFGVGGADKVYISTSALNLGNLNLTNPGTGHDAFADFVGNEHIDHTSVTITAGTGLSYSVGGTDISADATIDVDLNELTTSTTNAHGDYFVVVDSGDGAQYKLTKANIALSGFNNDSGWTSNTGTVTSVSAGNGMNFTTITSSGSVVLGTPSDVTQSSTNSVSATSHTHAWSHTSSSNWDSAWTHANGSTGADHTYINQSVTTGSTPSFAGLTLTSDIDMNNHSITEVNSITINDNGDNEGFMGPSSVWGLHHPETGSGGYDAVEITIDDPFQIRNGATLLFEVGTDGTIDTQGNALTGGGAGHDQFSDFIANEHINHTSVTLTAGDGLSGGGDISTNRTFNVDMLGLEDLSDPGGDRIYFWDDSETASDWLTPGSGLAISGTTIALGSLTADWDAGNHEIRAKTFESDVATRTAPLTVASTTKVTHLNADYLDGISSASFVRGDGTNNGTVTITADDADLILRDTTDGTTNYFWRDHSESYLYIGTGSAVIRTRSNVLPHSANTYDLGGTNNEWANLYIGTGKIYFYTDGAEWIYSSGSAMFFGVGGSDRWKISSGNDFMPQDNDSYDLGGPSNQIADGYFAGTVYTTNIDVGDVKFKNDIILTEDGDDVVIKNQTGKPIFKLTSNGDIIISGEIKYVKED